MNTTPPIESLAIPDTDDPGDGPAGPGVSPLQTLKDKIINGAAGSAAESIVAGSISKVQITEGPDAFYNSANGTINIPAKTTQALADFLHEFAHSQTDAQVRQQVGQIAASAGADEDKKAAIIEACRADEAFAVATEIFYLGLIPSTGSSGNALTTLGSHSEYLSVSDAVAIFTASAQELGLNPQTGSNTQALFQRVLQKVRAKISATAGLDSAVSYINHYFPPASGGGGDPAINPLPLPAPSPIPLPAPSPPSGTVTVSDPVPVPSPPGGTVTVSDPVPVPSPPEGGGGGGGGCVAVSSYLPDGRIAGDISIGDVMHLAHAQTLEDAMGEVTYSLRKTQPGYRIVTQSGASLVCSSSAPIPTTDGLVLAPMLLGKRVATRRALSTGTYKSEWEVVESVQEVGLIDVQHITVGDRCFWAGESMGAFILHHNLKAEPDPGDPDPWWDDVRHEKPDSDSAMSAITPPPKPILGANIDALGASLTQAMAGFSLTSAATVAAAEGATSIEMRLLPPQQ